MDLKLTVRCRQPYWPYFFLWVGDGDLRAYQGEFHAYSLIIKEKASMAEKWEDQRRPSAWLLWSQSWWRQTIDFFSACWKLYDGCLTAYDLLFLCPLCSKGLKAFVVLQKPVWSAMTTGQKIWVWTPPSKTDHSLCLAPLRSWSLAPSFGMS